MPNYAACPISSRLVLRCRVAGGLGRRVAVSAQPAVRPGARVRPHPAPPASRSSHSGRYPVGCGWPDEPAYRGGSSAAGAPSRCLRLCTTRRPGQPPPGGWARYCHRRSPRCVRAADVAGPAPADTTSPRSVRGRNVSRSLLGEEPVFQDAEHATLHHGAQEGLFCQLGRRSAGQLGRHGQREFSRPRFAGLV